MLLLSVYLNQPASPDDLRIYQTDRWGRMSRGETCVIELCGLAASAFSTAMDRKSFRKERVEIIRQKVREHRPKVVVMYGQNERRHWEEMTCPHNPHGWSYEFIP